MVMLVKWGNGVVCWAYRWTSRIETTMNERGALALAGHRSVAETSAAARRSRYNGHPSRPRNSSVEAAIRDDGGHRQSFSGHR
jgi:hypothetical protein